MSQSQEEFSERPNGKQVQFNSVAQSCLELDMEQQTGSK